MPFGETSLGARLLTKSPRPFSVSTSKKYRIPGSQKRSDRDLRESLDSREFRSLYRCATARSLLFITCSLLRRKVQQKTSLGTFLTSSAPNTKKNVFKFSNRVDRCYLEPRPWLHEEQPRMQALLRQDLCRAVSRCQGTSLRTGI